MRQEVFENFDTTLDHQAMIAKMRLKPGTKRAEDFTEMLKAAELVARPRAGVISCQPVMLETNHIRLGDTVFVSELLWEKIREEKEVYPYLITCGTELDAWAKGFDGIGQYWADEIMLRVLLNAQKQMVEKVAELSRHQRLSRVNPGFKRTWPITDQKPFFELLGELPERLGVILTSTFLMDPAKSSTGIMFQSDEIIDEVEEERLLTLPYSG